MKGTEFNLIILDCRGGASGTLLDKNNNYKTLVAEPLYTGTGSYATIIPNRLARSKFTNARNIDRYINREIDT